MAVRDTGIGIPAKHLSAFLNVSTVDKGRCRKRGGTGWGWPLSSISEKHQGKIDVESEYGEGSCFTITLPAFVDVEDLTAAASN